jgi:hypothetical protein
MLPVPPSARRRACPGAARTRHRVADRMAAADVAAEHRSLRGHPSLQRRAYRTCGPVARRAAVRNRRVIRRADRIHQALLAVAARRSLPKARSAASRNQAELRPVHHPAERRSPVHRLAPRNPLAVVGVRHIRRAAGAVRRTRRDLPAEHRTRRQGAHLEEAGIQGTAGRSRAKAAVVAVAAVAAGLRLVRCTPARLGRWPSCRPAD